MADIEEEKVAADQTKVVFKKRGKFRGRRRRQKDSSEEGIADFHDFRLILLYFHSRHSPDRDVRHGFSFCTVADHFCFSVYFNSLKIHRLCVEPSEVRLIIVVLVCPAF